MINKAAYLFFCFVFLFAMSFTSVKVDLPIYRNSDYYFLTNGILAVDRHETNNLTVDSGFSPDSISSLELWLDASDLTTITHVTNSVSLWVDKSSNVRTARQTVVSAQPRLVTNSINGNPTIFFDATRGNSFFGTNWIGVATNLTIYVVARSTNHVHSKTQWGRLLSQVAVGGSTDWSGSPTNLSALQTRWSNETNMYTYISGSSSAKVGIPTSSVFILKTVLNGSGSSNQVNSMAGQYTSMTIPPTLFNRFMISASDWNGISQVNGFWYGDIAEIIVYKKQLSNDENTNVKDYLANKWGISL